MRTLATYTLVKKRQLRRTRRSEAVRQSASRVGLGLGVLFSVLLALSIVIGALAYSYLFSDLPSIAILPASLKPDGAWLQPTRLYDRSGQTLLFALENPGVARRYVPLVSSDANHLPVSLVQATLAAYDPTFWDHQGYSLYGIREGFHPTLAQMLVSNLLLKDEPGGIRRSLRERTLAAQVTARYGRDQVLEWYLNSASYGHLAYGADAAAQTYFGKPASQLDLAESIALVTISQSPAINPLDVPGISNSLQGQLIDRLVRLGWISTDEAVKARTEKLSFRKDLPSPPDAAPAFDRLVLDQLESLYGIDEVERGGMKVITTLDLGLQEQVLCTARTQVLRLQGNPNEVKTSSGGECQAAKQLPELPAEARDLPVDLSASTVVLDPYSGQVLALVEEAGVDGQSPSTVGHAPGSVVTPFIYLAGFTRGYSPASLTWDIPASFPAGMENLSNPDGQFHGPARMRTALANEYWASAAALQAQVGVENVWHTAAQLGLRSLDDPQVNSTPGFPFHGGRITLLEAAQAYGALAAQGTLAGQARTEAGEPLRSASILKVNFLDGSQGLDWSVPKEQAGVSPQLSYLVTSILSDPGARHLAEGSTDLLDVGRPVAAKEGVTLSGSAWTAGYTPARVVVAWVGTTGRSGWEGKIEPGWAAGLWRAVMLQASQNIPALNWMTPPNITSEEVCDPSGLLPTVNCPVKVKEVFLQGNEPTRFDNLYQLASIDRDTGNLATLYTSPGAVEEHTFFNAPSVARDWAREAGFDLLPDTVDPVPDEPASPDATITSPEMFAYVSGIVQVKGSAGGENFASYQVDVGRGLYPEEWSTIGGKAVNPVRDGALAEWDTKGLSGLYALRLQVFDQDGLAQKSFLQVRVDNTKPEVRIVNPLGGDRIKISTSKILNFSAQADDDIGVTRVEWVLDGKIAGEVKAQPWSFGWQVESGKHSVQVKAYDAAGNVGESGVVEFWVE